MNILLKLANKPLQKELFVDENLKIYGKEEIILLIKKQRINNLSLAKRNGKLHVKSKSNTKTTDNISNKSISHTELLSFYKNYPKATTNRKVKEYVAIRKNQQKKSFIIVMDDRGDFVSTKTDDDINGHLERYKSAIIKAAREQKVDPNLLGAILIDEYCRMGWDDWLDWLGALNIKDTSIGIAQIKLSTAREILKKQYYNPAPGKITSKSPPAQIWLYLNQPEHSIYFSAAVIKLSIDYWQKKKIDVSNQPKILAYLYSSGYTKNIKGATGKRCTQISTDFYQKAKSILL